MTRRTADRLIDLAEIERLTRLRIEALAADHPSPRPVRLPPTPDWL